ncbi:MAG: 3-deoxy-D-manno-octulosonic acid transferase [Candidatus Coatesbacteria bacterium]|nr:3-deoxy-D-manno-octulosonic acid transferase [Candidatus Coatesbacteria bacterium]
MLFIYNLLLHSLLIALSPVLLLLIISSKKYRQNFRERLGLFKRETFAAISNIRGKPVLIHAVSVGEVGIAIPLIARLNELGIPVALSTITTTGQAYARERLGDSAAIFYMPFDLPLLQNRMLSLLDPRSVIILETEIWPNLIRSASKLKIPIALVNGRISDKSFGRYRRTGFLWRRLLPRLSRILVQTELYRDRLLQMGAPAESLAVAGTIKLDIDSRELQGEEKERAAREFGIDPKRPLFVAGSTHPGEEGPILDAFISIRSDFPDLAMVLAPRHVHRGAELAEMASQRGIRFALRSSGLIPDDGFDLLILDTIGELVKAYQVGTVAFVGKSLPPAQYGQNPVEPVACAVPTLFGPNMQNFRFVADILTRSGAAKCVRDVAELSEKLRKLLASEEKRQRMAAAAREVLASNRGATDRIMGVLEAEGFLKVEASRDAKHR